MAMICFRIFKQVLSLKIPNAAVLNAENVNSLLRFRMVVGFLRHSRYAQHIGKLNSAKMLPKIVWFDL